MHRITADAAPERFTPTTLAAAGITEADLQGWIIADPGIIDDELLIITAEYGGFEGLRDRLDLLALDPSGTVVLIELKRDRADATTDLQALKYASYCATLTARDLQEQYQRFWGDRGETPLSIAAVRDAFAAHLTGVETAVDDEGDWLRFPIDDRPRVLLVAGSFGTEVTSPVLWLQQEFGIDLRCIRVDTYTLDAEAIVLDTRQILPVPETAEYQTRRTRKEQAQAGSRRPPAIGVLLERGVLSAGDTVAFDTDRLPAAALEDADPAIFTATVTGETGQSALEGHDGERHSVTGAAHRVFELVAPQEQPSSLNGYKYWMLDGQTLSALRNADR